MNGTLEALRNRKGTLARE